MLGSGVATAAMNVTVAKEKMTKETKEMLIAFVKAQHRFNQAITGESFLGTPEAARAVYASSAELIIALEKEPTYIPACLPTPSES